MGFHRSKADVMWSDAGDFVIDSVREDLQDTTSLPYRAFIQQLVTRVQSDTGDWRLQPSIGLNLSKFLGKPNTSRLGSEIQASVTIALTKGGFLASNEFTVDAFPIDKHQIAILIFVRPSGDRDQIRLSFTYNSKDNKVIPRNL